MFRNRIPKGRVLLEVKVPFPWLIGVLVAVGVVVILALVGLALRPHRSALRLPHHQTRGDHLRADGAPSSGRCLPAAPHEPGVFNYLIKNLQGATNIILYASNLYEWLITTAVGTASCVQRHPKAQLERTARTSTTSAPTTRDSVRRVNQCTACHAEWIPRHATGSSARGAEQDAHRRRHDGKQLLNDCNICDVGGAPPEEINVPIEGRSPPSQRAGGPSRTRPPAPIAITASPRRTLWAGSRSTAASSSIGARSSAHRVYTQQDRTFCIDCHGVITPHPAAGSPSATPSGVARIPACASNVTARTAASGATACRCHILLSGGFHAPRARRSSCRAGAASAIQPVLRRWLPRCRCLPHSAAFIADHPSHVYNQGSICMKCHGNGGTGPRGCYGGQCHSGSIP